MVIREIALLLASKREGILPLAKLAHCVAQRLNPQHRVSLEEKIENCCDGYPDSLRHESCAQNSEQPARNASNCNLLIVVSPSQMQPDCYLITVFLDRKNIRNIDKPFRKEELSHVIQNLLLKTYSELMSHLYEKGLNKKDVWIRFFLPRQLLSEEVDQYETKLRRLGAEFKVTVSLWERKFHEYIVPLITCWDGRCQADLKKSIMCVHNIVPGEYDKIQDESYTPAGVVNENSDGYDLLEYFEDSQTPVAILTFRPKETSCEDKRDHLYWLFHAGVPVILWARCSDPKGSILKLIEKKPFDELPNHVCKERREAFRSKNQAHLGCHLTLLWDDPTLIESVRHAFKTPT